MYQSKILTPPMMLFCNSHKRYIIHFLLFMIVVVLLTSCKKSETNTISEKSNDTGIHKTFERGPVSVHIELDKNEITIAERLNLTITIISDEEYDVKLPGFGDKLEQFGIVDYQTTQPSLTSENRSKISRSYILEPFLSGEYVIPPMKIIFKKRNDVSDTDHEIETEEISVNVTSLLPENFEQMSLHDIKPPENLPQTYYIWMWAGVFAVVTLFSGFVIFLIIQKRKKSGDAITVNKKAAHLVAFDELNALVSENLVEKGHIKVFYQKISDIVRRYIENRFNINAPEQTTEEFLSGIQLRNDFDEKYKTLLKKYLTHCDLVKFAMHHPETEDIQNTFDSSKNFIIETKEEE